MPKRTFLYLTVLFFISSKIYSQVNLQMGGATFSLPVFNWQDDKSKLNSIIALSYSSGSGLRVNDIATNVGQGWNLVAGGVITRVQVGQPDDQVARNGNGTPYDITKYPAGILYASTQAYKGCPIALTKYPIFGWRNQLYAQHNEIAEDKELDYFSFQFNGKAGMFVLDPTNIGTGIFIGDTKMKVTFQQDAGLQSQGIRTKITSFTIQDINGLLYKFTRHGLTKVLESAYCHGDLSIRLDQPGFKPDHVYHQAGFENASYVNPYVISSWYLVEVEDPLTHRKIFLNYTTRYINSDGGEDIMYNVEKNYTVIYHKKSITQTPAITSIVYPDGHTASFNYGNARIDLNGDYAMSSIDITYNGRYLSRHEFNTTYVMLNRYGTPVSDYQKKVARLYLKSVRKIGVDLKEDSPPYLFDYYLGSNTAGDFVPPPFFYAKDIWGFYNADNSKGYWYENVSLSSTATQLSNNQLRGLCFMRNGVSGIIFNPKPGYAKNGLLRQIIYPTGGTLTYDYLQNTGVLNETSSYIGGVHVSMTSSTDGGFSNGCGNAITTQYNFILSGGASSLWGIETPVNSTFSTTHYQPEWKYYKWLGCFPFGCCDWKFKFPGIMAQQQAVDLSVFQNVMNYLGPVLEIINIIGTISDVVTALSAGNPVFIIIDIIVGLVNLAVTCIGNQSRDSDHTTFYNYDLNNTSPLPAQFKRVEVIEGTRGIGKTVQEFTNSDDYPLWVGIGANPFFTAKQRFAPWAYGLPKKTTVFDVNGNKVKETENVYNYSNTKSVIGLCTYHPSPNQCNPNNLTGLQTNIVSCNCIVYRSSSQRNTTWSDPAQYNNSSSYIITSNDDLKVDPYAMYTGRTELTTTYERVFKAGDPTQYLETITSYYYHTTNYEVNSIVTAKSDGGTVSKTIKYSIDFTGGVITTLLNNNIVSLPIETISSVNNPLGTMGTINESITEFIQLANGDIKPYRTLDRRFSQPVNTTNFYQGPAADNSLLNLKTTQTFTYDNTGNLIGIKDEGNRMVTNLYGYNDKYIVASVINADPLSDNCSYAGFEDPTNWIGWTLTGTASYNTSTAITGVRSFNLSASTTFSRGLNTAKAYTLSFWSTSGITVTSGATLIKSAPTINGFTYFEYDIALGTSSVSVSGNTIIDELRLYPKTARMRSIAYDPLIGKVSESDENNRITYYEYDNLGRLRFIKDENRNIVKMYEYNNISPSRQNGCPGTYYNKFISEVFRKNCGPGYIADSIVFTVPANTFSSTISQTDADAQAENYILTNGQNYANTNGTCISLYYNSAQSQTFTTENCPVGYAGGNVTYTVPANRYSSTVSQAAANQLALDEIAANGQSYANDPAHAVCTISYDPLWTWLEGASWYCQYGHLFVLETDINPSSSSYNQTRWSDVGASDLCPPASVSLTYINQTGQAQYVVLTNTSTQQQYYYYMSPYTNGILGDVPEGTYDIQVYDDYGTYLNNYEAGCGYSTTGYGANFYNVLIYSSCYSINVYPWYY